MHRSSNLSRFVSAFELQRGNRFLFYNCVLPVSLCFDDGDFGVMGPQYLSLCYAHLHQRAVNCRKKKCGHINQVKFYNLLLRRKQYYFKTMVSA
ncbi:putative ribosomal protein L40e [Rosa chinensis]|uniref:Putative ribosomal protein L40e n=1 Tax=Rosa chinensis TaxID=74649 RepID=A0A2P6PNY2_ROSCH|nr:putative ribosomal protein L40e [Rosa chinensis]